MREVYELVAENVKNSLTSMRGKIAEKILHNSLSSLMMIQRCFPHSASHGIKRMREIMALKNEKARARARDENQQ